MTATHEGDRMIQKLKLWGENQALIRAMLLTSSRTNPHAEVDLFSDYDVILVVNDIRPFFEDRSWLGEFGEVLVVYQDPIKIRCGFEQFAYITQYKDGYKIDFTLWPVELLKGVVAAPRLPEDLDNGYAVLLDKDDLTVGMKAPTYHAYIPSPPIEEEYQKLIEVFFHEATYVAKHLWRDDLMAAKYNLDHVMKMKKLRRILEWRVEIDQNWSQKMSAYGRGLKKVLKPEIWSELESTYVGTRVEENWDALFKTIALFRKIAIDVGNRLGYSYPSDLDSRMMDYLHKVKDLDPEAKRFLNN